MPDNKGMDRLLRFNAIHRKVYHLFSTRVWSTKKYACWYVGYNKMHRHPIATTMQEIVDALKPAEKEKLWKELKAECGEKLDNINTEDTEE